MPKLEDADVDYDQVVRTLAFDARAKPKNRTRTEEEIAVEEKERLEMAEAERLRRMRGEVSDEEHEGGSRNRRRTGGRRPDGDDPDDDFIEEENDLLGPQLTRQDLESMRLPNEKEDEEYETPEENAESDEEDEQDSDEEDGTETGEGDEESEASKMDDLLGNPSSEKVRGTEEFENNLACTPKRKARDRPKVPKKELPYTFPCPSSIEDFENILEGLEDSALSTVVQRIRSLHHPSLAQGNKEKLQVGVPDACCIS